MSTEIIIGDCRDILRTLPSDHFDCIVTSPPYFGLRDYGVDGQIGLEPTAEEYDAAAVDVFREGRRVLKPTGTCWLNLGDSYATKPSGKNVGATTLKGSRRNHAASRQVDKSSFCLPNKSLMMIPARVAIALQDDGWWVRSEIVWHKPSPMPESVKDRPTSAHEKVFLITKNERYYYDADAIAEQCIKGSAGSDFHRGKTGARDGGDRTSTQERVERDTKNARNVWTLPSQPFPGAHFATMPPKLAERCILAGCPIGGTVLDPFGGAGTTALAADRLGRHATIIELNPEFAEMARARIEKDSSLLSVVAMRAA